jgi:hypothetical protein
MSEADERSFDSQIGSPEIRSALIHLVRAKGVPKNDWDDVVSDAIAEACRMRGNFNPARASVRTWVEAVAEKVIGRYHRKRSTKKRKPLGGVVSLDQSNMVQSKSGEEHSDYADPNAETPGVRSELDDIAERADLSEKEKIAIASRLGKDIGGDFTSSTTHRAFQKLRQVRDDQKFRERPAEARLSECAYGTIPAAEHDTALRYDVLRRTAWFVDAVDRWKKSVEWKEMATELEKERESGRFPLTILPRYWPEEFHRYYRKANERSPRLRRRFGAAVEIALAISEWPILSYCCLDPKKRRHQLEQFGWMFGKEPFWEINERTFELVIDAVEPQTLSKLSAFLEMINKAPQNGSETYNSVHIVRVDWRFPLKSIVTSFEKWAAEEKIQWRGIPKIQRAGRPRNRLLLGYAFGRLTSEFGLSKGAALSWLKERYGRPASASPERIGRAAKHAHDTLKDFLPTPAEIGL